MLLISPRDSGSTLRANSPRIFIIAGCSHSNSSDGQASRSWTSRAINVAAADLSNACSACIGQFFTLHAPLLWMLQVHLVDT
jgi:hypothetical protein